jgi:hypothetical protein
MEERLKRLEAEVDRLTALAGEPRPSAYTQLAVPFVTPGRVALWLACLVLGGVLGTLVGLIIVHHP